MISMEISKWLYSTPFSKFLAEIQKDVIGQPNLAILCANIYNYIQNIVYNTPINNNTIIAAPSGSGKTQTYRALKKYFSQAIPSLPVHIFDLSGLAPSGYRGSEKSEIVEPFFSLGLRAPAGIVFLDEFDKKLTPSITSSGNDFSKEAQAGILTLIEGGEVCSKDKNTRISTENIMFIGLGSFDYFRKDKEEQKASIGFSQDTITRRDHFEYITRENMLEIGGSNELLGRFPLILNYDKLSEESVDMIIDKYLYDMSDSFDCSLEVTGEFVDVLKNSANSNFGCRLIESKIRTAILNIYTQALLEKKDKHELEITIKSETDGTFKWIPYQNALNDEDKRWVDYFKDETLDNDTDLDEIIANTDFDENILSAANDDSN